MQNLDFNKLLSMVKGETGGGGGGAGGGVRKGERLYSVAQLERDRRIEREKQEILQKRTQQQQQQQQQQQREKREREGLESRGYSKPSQASIGKSLERSKYGSKSDGASNETQRKGSVENRAGIQREAKRMVETTKDKDVSDSKKRHLTYKELMKNAASKGQALYKDKSKEGVGSGMSGMGGSGGLGSRLGLGSGIKSRVGEEARGGVAGAKTVGKSGIPIRMMESAKSKMKRDKELQMSRANASLSRSSAGNNGRDGREGNGLSRDNSRANRVVDNGGVKRTEKKLDPSKVKSLSISEEKKERKVVQELDRFGVKQKLKERPKERSKRSLTPDRTAKSEYGWKGSSKGVGIDSRAESRGSSRERYESSSLSRSYKANKSISMSANARSTKRPAYEPKRRSRYEEEDEYDSMDGFIVSDEDESDASGYSRGGRGSGGGGGNLDYRKELYKITGYDARRYNDGGAKRRRIAGYDDDGDSSDMEASIDYLNQEEHRSLKIAKLEDMIEEQRELEEERRYKQAQKQKSMRAKGK
ncbi:hypothetical protein AX774_g5445 [Zancudomyces culisetae]|uniref:Uncharacterized protein n=1 Tax=Zancudomyces culisetae TaxID=1213189 RepID=A0A1R1PJF1_ZANCU|nr:hypothetical protein AX774_g5445 [Zancudomyces culisetae]|eukprot:OMH81100.1 hypothetical protein AX774_g5445 [Zancudomyces culisetae]